MTRSQAQAALMANIYKLTRAENAAICLFGTPFLRTADAEELKNFGRER